MSWAIPSSVRAAITKMAVAAALVAIAAGATVPANATDSLADTFGAPARLDDPVPGPGPEVPTNPLDPRCAQMPTFAMCQGGPYAPQPRQLPPAVPPPPAGPPMDADPLPR